MLLGLLILVGGAACVVLTRRWTPALPRPLVLVTVVAPVVTGGVFALAHGVAGVVMNVLDLTGVITLDKPLLADPTPLLAQRTAADSAKARADSTQPLERVIVNAIRGSGSAPGWRVRCSCALEVAQDAMRRVETRGTRHAAARVRAGATHI